MAHPPCELQPTWIRNIVPRCRAWYHLLASFARLSLARAAGESPEKTMLRAISDNKPVEGRPPIAIERMSAQPFRIQCLGSNLSRPQVCTPIL